MADRACEQGKALGEVVEGQLCKGAVLVVVRIESKRDISGHKIELVVGEAQPELKDTRALATYDKDGDVLMSG